jgi:hypothetical protein
VKVFHYSQIERWSEIVKGSWKSGEKPGLGASHRMGHHDDEAFNTCAVFALLEPIPESWTQNPYFKDVWQWLIADIGDLLLEIEVDPETDNVLVVDRGHLEGFLYEDKTGIPERYMHLSRKAAERAMMESKIPLGEFLARKKELQYSLPEVIFPQNVPLDKISVSTTQSSLEVKLSKYNRTWEAELMRRVKGIPELQSWHSNYEASQRATVSKERR